MSGRASPRKFLFSIFFQRSLPTVNLCLSHQRAFGWLPSPSATVCRDNKRPVYTGLHSALFTPYTRRGRLDCPLSVHRPSTVVGYHIASPMCLLVRATEPGLGQHAPNIRLWIKSLFVVCLRHFFVKAILRMRQWESQRFESLLSISFEIWTSNF